MTENKPKHIQEKFPFPQKVFFLNQMLLFQVHHLPVAVLQHYQGFYVTEKIWRSKYQLIVIDH